MVKISRGDLQKLHELTLQMAEVFVDFCRKNHLTCYLCGGGCIGAVRHKGWIPWDDDLDFFMPREDYEKAVKLWKIQMKDSRYKMELSDQEHIIGNLFFVIRDSETTYIKPYQKDMDITQGIVLDVLPLDGYPDGWFARKVFIVLRTDRAGKPWESCKNGGENTVKISSRKKSKIQVIYVRKKTNDKTCDSRLQRYYGIMLRSGIYEKLVSEKCI